MDMGGYRKKPLHTNELKNKAVLKAAKESLFYLVKDMAIVDPERRASGAQMLDKVFNGEGCTTPRIQIRSSFPVHLDEPALPDETATSPQPKRRSRVPGTDTTAYATAATPFAAPTTGTPALGGVITRQRKARAKPSGITKISTQKYPKKAITDYRDRFQIPGAFPDTK